MTVPDGTPTTGEIGRGLEEIKLAVRELRRELVESQARMETNFLSRREYDLSQQADSVQMRGLEAEVHKLGKQMEACETKRAADTAEWARLREQDRKEREEEQKKLAEQRRQDRTLILTGVAFPILAGLILAALLAWGGLT